MNRVEEAGQPRKFDIPWPAEDLQRSVGEGVAEMPKRRETEDEIAKPVQTDQKDALRVSRNIAAPFDTDRRTAWTLRAPSVPEMGKKWAKPPQNGHRVARFKVAAAAQRRLPAAVAASA